MNLKDSFQYIGTRFLYLFGGVYTFVSILRFGFQYQDISQLITNIAVGNLFALMGFLFGRQESQDKDFQSIDSRLNTLENNLIDFKNSSEETPK